MAICLFSINWHIIFFSFAALTYMAPAPCSNHYQVKNRIILRWNKIIFKTFHTVRKGFAKPSFFCKTTVGAETACKYRQYSNTKENNLLFHAFLNPIQHYSTNKKILLSLFHIIPNNQIISVTTYNPHEKSPSNTYQSVPKTR